MRSRRSIEMVAIMPSLARAHKSPAATINVRYEKRKLALDDQKENVMLRKNWPICGLAILFGLAVLCNVQAEDVKPSDEGKAAAFKGKTFDMNEKGETAIT